VRRLAALALLALAGCGGSGGGDGGADGRASATSIVDRDGQAPLVNSLEVEPGSGALLVTTNRGFWRVTPGREPEQIRGTATARGRSAPVGGFLEVLPTGPRELLGSGHPDARGALPEYLGLLRSEDGGTTWSSLSRLGEADLHRMVEKHGRLYAFDAVLGALLISADGGKTFEERFTPQETMVELEIDPGDPERVLIASEETTFRSEDGGRRWRPLARAPGTRLAWPAEDRLYRAEADGRVSVSADGGERFEPVGQLEGEPARMKAVDADHLYVVLETGAILETRDGARSWKAVYTP
jgi:photosystem II stability/assembly factor-like uncharacterized protein